MNALRFGFCLLVLGVAASATEVRAQGVSPRYPVLPPQPIPGATRTILRTSCIFSPRIPAPPADAPAPGDDGSTAGPSSPQVRPGQPACAPGGAARTGSATPGRARGAQRPAEARTSVVDADHWDMWWEANKFDFIELQRGSRAYRSASGSGLWSRSDAPQAGPDPRLLERVLPVLHDLTDSPDAGVRASAIVALAKTADPATVAAAERLLQDPSLDVRRAALLALGILDDGRAAWRLMNIAEDTLAGRRLMDGSALQVDDRGTAVVACALRGRRAAEPMVRSLLARRAGMHPDLLAMTATAAGLMGSQRALQPLVVMAFDDDLPQHVRSSAVTALGRVGEPVVLPALTDLLEADLEPRRAAAVALGIVGQAAALPVVQRLARVLEKDADAATRHLAAISLGRIGGDAAGAVLEQALRRARPDMRPWLALGLALCERAEPRGRAAGLLLQRMKREGSPETLGAYAIALGLTGDPAGVDALARLVRRASVEVAGQAALALGISGQRRAAPALRETVATGRSPFVLRQAALGLGILADRASIPALLELVRTTRHPEVAAYTALGIAFMGDPEAAGPLLELIAREGPTGVTTTWAVAALGQLLDQEPRPTLSRLAAGDNYLSRPSAVTDLLSLGL